MRARAPRVGEGVRGVGETGHWRRVHKGKVQQMVKSSRGTGDDILWGG